MSNNLAQSLKLIQTCFVLSQATSGTRNQLIFYWARWQILCISSSLRVPHALESWLTFFCCFQPFVDFRTFSVIFLKTMSRIRNQLILYWARWQMLCISTSFRVLNALESWLTFFGCFQPFFDFRSYSVTFLKQRATSGTKNQLILYWVRWQMLCISTSFWVLRTLESWSTYFFGCFQPFLLVLKVFQWFLSNDEGDTKSAVFVLSKVTKIMDGKQIWSW